jgi:hypothetical protein
MCSALCTNNFLFIKKFCSREIKHLGHVFQNITYTPATSEEAASECTVHDLLQNIDGRYLDDNEAIFATEIMSFTFSPI